MQIHILPLNLTPVPSSIDDLVVPARGYVSLDESLSALLRRLGLTGERQPLASSPPFHAQRPAM